MERSCWWGMGTGYNHLMRMQNFAAHVDEKMMQGEATSLTINLKHYVELAAVPWVETVQIGHYSHRLLLLQGPSRMKMAVSTECNEWEGMIPHCFAPKFACLLCLLLLKWFQAIPPLLLGWFILHAWHVCLVTAHCASHNKTFGLLSSDVHWWCAEHF